MPIGSKSYYDSLAETNPEPKISLFRREPKSRAEKPNQTPPHTPAPAKSPDSEAPLTALQIDAVVSQILELASRTGAVLERAEEMAKRAEEMFAAACDSVQRAEAAAMRAEVAVARLELDIDGDSSEDEGGEEPSREHELELVAQITERLRNGLQQIDGLSNKFALEETVSVEVVAEESLVVIEATSMMTSSVDVSEPTLSLVDSSQSNDEESRPDFQRENWQYSRAAGRSSFSRTPNAPVESDALAHSLVSVCHDSGIPRVSPYIIQVPASGEHDPHFASATQLPAAHDGSVNIAI